MKNRFLSALVVWLVGVSLFAGGDNLLKNGDFQTDANGDGWPDGWKRLPGVNAEKSGDNLWLSVSKTYQGPKFVIPIDSSWTVLNFKAKLKATDVLVGRESWKDGRIAMSFVDGEGNKVGAYPKASNIKGTTDWKDYDFQMPVPKGAKNLTGSLIMFGPSGKVEFDDIIVTVAEMDAKKKSVEKKAVEIPEAVEVGTELVINGDLEKGSEGWFKPSFPKILKDDNGNYAEIVRGTPLTQSILIPKDTGSLKLTMRMKSDSIVKGKKSWYDGRMAMAFKDVNDKQVGGFPSVFSVEGTTDWKLCERVYSVPENALTLNLSGYMMGESGKFYIGDVFVVVESKKVSKPTKLEVGTELVTNGGFKKDSEGWDPNSFPKVLEDDGKLFVTIPRGKAVSQVVDIPVETESVILTMKMKSDGIVKGSESWHDGRLAMSFHDSTGKQVGPWPKTFSTDGTEDWVDCERVYDVPDGATTLKLSGYMMGKSGTISFADISVKVNENFKKAQPSACPVDASNIWSYVDAFVQNTPTRTKICLNGFWKFLPEKELSGKIEAPAADANWGWFKVPGVWPNPVKSYEPIKTKVQDFILDPSFSKRFDLYNLQFGWYERELAVPAHFAGRRILLDFELIQAQVVVFIDGKQVELLRFPGGKVDITDYVKPGKKHRLDLLLIAKPLKEDATVVMDVTNVFKVKARLGVRGITGDVFLLGIPKETSIENIRFTGDTDEMKLKTEVSFEGQVPSGATVSVDITEDKKSVKKSKEEKVAVKKDGYTEFKEDWKDANLWDINTPENLYYGTISLKDKDGKLLDQSFPVRFGFREFKIVGKDFYLNNRRIHWRTLVVDSMNAPADLSNKRDVLSTLENIKEYGFNSVITHNYHFRPGGVTYMQGLLDATDEAGVMLSFSLPHGTDFDWNFSEPAVMDEYIRISEYLINKVWNHPATVLYTMNHNQCGYSGDLNPLSMDGVFSPEYGRDAKPAERRVQAEMLADTVRKIDPTRPVYHHSSGNLGDIYSNNIYLNWSPMQERSDWTQYWSTNSIKPIFFVEWGLPHVASWSSYRGPNFIWRTEALQSMWDSEFAAAFLGNDAYVMTPTKEKQMQHEEKLWKQSPDGFNWGYLCQPLRSNRSLYHNITAMFVDANWKNLRAWGTTAMLPWDQERLEEPVNKISKPVKNPDKYKNLKKPGIVPDYYLPVKHWLYERKQDEFEPEVIGNAFMKWNQPVIAWIAGNASHFTETAGNFNIGDQVAKQIAVVNDSREPVTIKYSWNVEGLSLQGEGSITVDVGSTGFKPLDFVIPKHSAPGRYKIVASFDINGKQSDYSFEFNAMQNSPKIKLKSKVALYDPENNTAADLLKLGVKFTKVEASADLSRYGLLIIGRKALNYEKSIKDIGLVEQGLNVVIFAQESTTLQDKLGFRVNEHGLRKVFIRDSGSPLVAGLSDALFSNWQGESTTLPQFIVDGTTLGNPTWRWAGHSNTRVWRNQNWGNVAHSLIEKPPVGNFLPVIDGGFELQYVALMEYTQGKGSIIFCQAEVIGRTVPDPAAEKLLANILSYVDTREPAEFKKVYYIKDKNVEKLLNQLHIESTLYTGAENIDNAILVVGPESKIPASLNQLAKAGTEIFGLALSSKQIKIVTAGQLKATIQNAKSMPIEDSSDKIFAGLSNAEFYLKTLKLQIPVIVDENTTGKSYLFRSIENGSGSIVLSQIAPWQFDYLNPQLAYLRTTFRRDIYMVSRVLKNLGADSKSDLIAKLNADKSLYYQPLVAEWKGVIDPDNKGESLGYLKPDFNDSAWREFKVDCSFDDQYDDLFDYDGYFWYRTKFDKPEKMTSEDMTFFIGPVDDESKIWLNGKFLGEINKTTNPDDYWMVPRKFELKRSDLKEKDNLLIIRVNDTYMKGGVVDQPAFKTLGPWLDSYYIQTPDKNDDPYRFYRW